MKDYEKQRYKERIKIKEQSLLVHIAECDRLRKENIRLNREIEILNERLRVSNKEFCDCDKVIFIHTVGITIFCSRCGKPVKQNSMERT
jgi:hypothetical protein